MIRIGSLVKYQFSTTLGLVVGTEPSIFNRRKVVYAVRVAGQDGLAKWLETDVVLVA